MKLLPLVLAMLFACPLPGAAQVTPGNIDADVVRVRLTVSERPTFEDIIRLVDPSLPTTGLR